MMRGSVRDMKYMYFARCTAAMQGAEVVDTYAEPTGFYGNLAQENGQQAAALYGIRLPYVKRITNATAVLLQGDGVWIDAPMTEEPDYRVRAVLPYARTVEYVVEKRGVYGG